MEWKTARRVLTFERPVVMGILNVTPDSFSDGGKFVIVEDALRHAEKMIADGADVIDIGGESTRPGSVRVTSGEEVDRVVPVIGEIVRNFDVPVSVDTTRSDVASAALGAGAEIINDVSGLRWDARVADVAAQRGAGLILMHSRGEFGTMHSQAPVEDIFVTVAADFERSLDAARAAGVRDEQIALDVGIGFGKTQEQNLELISKLDKLVAEFERYPIMVGTSRKSFIGKLLGGSPAAERLGGSIATAVMALQKGARILRVHDVRETVAACRLIDALGQ